MANEIAALKTAWEETKSAFDGDFKKVVSQLDLQKKEYGDGLGQTKEKIANIEKVFGDYEKKWEEFAAQKKASEAAVKALEDSVLELKRLPTGDRNKHPEIKSELAKFYSEEKAFAKFIRSGEERMKEPDIKALATDADTQGGFLMSPNMIGTMVELNVLYSPIRQVANVLTISTGDALEIPKEGSTVFSAGWVGERAARTETTAGTFGMVRIPTHELEANPRATQKMLDDAAFDVESYIAKKLGEQFGKAEGTAHVSGSGVGKPQGISLGGGATATVTTSDAFTSSQLIAMQYALEEPYASRATWLSKRANFGQIRTLTAATDNFLWQPGLSAGEPPTLLGRPYLSCNDIHTAASGDTSADQLIYFGDWKAAYTIVDRLGVRVLRDPYTNKPMIEFTTYKRTGGQVVLSEAYIIGVGA